MSKLNISVNLSTYSDSKASNSPSLSNFKWNRVINGVPAENAQSQVFTIEPGDTIAVVSSIEPKKMVYLESNLEIDLALDGGATTKVKPIIINSAVYPGMFLKTSDISSIVVTNPSVTETATIFIATVE